MASAHDWLTIALSCEAAMKNYKPPADDDDAEEEEQEEEEEDFTFLE